MLFEELDAGRFERARILQAKLLGARDSARAREAVVRARVADAKGRLEIAEAVDQALDRLQARAHRRSVGAFERLLTAIVRDVLPEKGEVKLKLYQERGAPALDVHIQNEGALEDAFDGSGGAVTNVLSAGLRFAALSRTGARRLIVLDEPDCWIKPERVLAFVRVLADVARRAGTQTILISHHEPELFEDLVSLVKLTRAEDGAARVEVLRRAAEWPDEATPGLRSIHLQNFRAHADTVLPLFPGVTALIGDNDLGKSTAAAASLRAVAYGEGDDSWIRHGQEEARVTLEIENGVRVGWIRRAKAKSGAPKVSYMLYERGASEPTREGRPATRGQVPEWVTELLGIERIGELDIQVGNQKSPVFLLNESAPRRAQVLSVGRESNRLSSLIVRYGDLKRSDRAQVREGEEELARLADRISRSQPVEEIGEALARMAEDLKNIEAAHEGQRRLVSMMDRIETVEKWRQRAKTCAEALAVLPQPVEIRDTRALGELVRRIERSAWVLRAKAPPPLPDAPHLHDTAPIALAGQTIARLQKRLASSTAVPQMPDPPQLHDLGSLIRVASSVSARAAEVERRRQALAEAEAAVARAHDAEAAVIEELGGVCPLCGGELQA